MTTENDIVLKPSFFYWLAANIPIMVLIPIIFWASSAFIVNVIIQAIGAALSLGLLIWLFYRYVDKLLCTKWVITSEQIQIKRGVFIKTINYIELYRVTDYKERKTLLQMLFQNKTVVIRSGDPTHPILYMYGITKDCSIIPTIRQRVEQLRQEKGIYEFTNRG